MNILKKPYQLSIWSIDWSSNDPIERRVAIIGSDTMLSQARALDPVLNRNINGTTTFTFSMYGKYIDNITGEEVSNPFIPYLHNETLLKLFYDDKWYDLIIKSSTESSTNNLYNFSASDWHINELSKNGFNLIIDQTINESYGTVTELGNRILEDTDWKVDIDASHCAVQTINEGLVKLQNKKGIYAYRINDEKVHEGKGLQLPAQQTYIAENSTIYAFYSSCKNKPLRFQFIYVEDNKFSLDDQHIITNKLSQYYIEVEQADYTNEGYSLIIPSNFLYDTSDGDLIPSDMRGNRYVYGQKTRYNAALKRNLTLYKDLESQSSNDQYWCDIETEYITPTVVSNLSGNTDFKTSSGWSAQGIYFDSNIDFSNITVQKGTVTAKAVDDLLEAITDQGKFIPQNAVPYLYYEMTDAPGDIEPVLVSSGPHDNKHIIKNLVCGEEYAIMIKFKEDIIVKPPIDIASYSYDPSKGLYFGTGKTFLHYSEFEWKKYDPKEKTFLPAYSNSNKDLSDTSVYENYYYQIAKVNNQGILSENEYQALKVQMFIRLHVDCGIEDIQFFKVNYQDFVFEEGQAPTKTIITPKSGLMDVVIKNTYKFYDDSVLSATNMKDVTPYFVSEYDFPDKLFYPVYYETGEKVKSITVKESNYFNSLQSLCETFETWVDFIIDREPDGSIKEKRVAFKNYVGDNNYAGFRYGINLQSINRKIDSKNIVTKMIVKNNNNIAAKNGSCSIARANINESGENCLYNFSYYVNKKLIDGDKLSSILYDTKGAKGEDWDKQKYDGDDNEHKEITNCNGYYTRLRLLNSLLDAATQKNTEFFIPLNQAQANLNTATASCDAAIGNMETALLDFEAVAGFAFVFNEDGSIPWTDEQKKIVKSSEELQQYLTSYIESKIQFDIFQKKKEQAQLSIETLQALYDESNEEIEDLTKQKARLHKAFQKLYGAFIQEGTWIDEKYYDDEQYYMDAQSTMLNSCFPQISYTINVAEISQLPNYTHYKSNLGDKTFIEDTEFFGYNINGTPYREEIVLTEISESLDNPSKNTIKVQNYKTQFQDLFQRITAQVQQTKFAQGSYDKAAALANGENQAKVSFLKDALEDSELVLKNAGEQSVTWDEQGVIITDKSEPSEQIRLVGGAILIKGKDDSGLGVWKNAITSKGVSADLITSGRIDTEKLQIMNGNQPTFRWDSYGLTAYNFNTTQNLGIGKVDFSKGVRYDRFGIYGYNTNSTVDFNTKNLSSAQELLNKDEVIFGLTWEGLKVSGVNGATITIGKQDNSIILVQDANKKETFRIGLDGKVEATGLKIIGGIDGIDEVITQDYINQFDISAKSIVIYDDTLNYNNRIFSAESLYDEDGNLNGGSVYLAGWTVTKDELSTGSFGQDGGFHIYPNGYTTQDASIEQQYFHQSDNLTWALGIGKNFGVTTSGHLYASGAHIDGKIVAEDGKIGAWILKDKYLSDDTYSAIISGNDGVRLNNGEILRFGLKMPECKDIHLKINPFSKSGPWLTVVDAGDLSQNNEYGIQYSVQGTSFILNSARLHEKKNGAVRIEPITWLANNASVNVWENCRFSFDSEPTIKDTFEKIEEDGGKVLIKSPSCQISIKDLDSWTSIDIKINGIEINAAEERDIPVFEWKHDNISFEEAPFIICYVSARFEWECGYPGKPGIYGFNFPITLKCRPGEDADGRRNKLVYEFPKLDSTPEYAAIKDTIKTYIKNIIDTEYDGPDWSHFVDCSEFTFSILTEGDYGYLSETSKDLSGVNYIGRTDWNFNHIQKIYPESFFPFKLASNFINPIIELSADSKADIEGNNYTPIIKQTYNVFKYNNITPAPNEQTKNVTARIPLTGQGVQREADKYAAYFSNMGTFYCGTSNLDVVNISESIGGKGGIRDMFGNIRSFDWVIAQCEKIKELESKIAQMQT